MHVAVRVASRTRRPLSYVAMVGDPTVKRIGLAQRGGAGASASRTWVVELARFSGPLGKDEVESEVEAALRRLDLVSGHVRVLPGGTSDYVSTLWSPPPRQHKRLQAAGMTIAPTWACLGDGLEIMRAQRSALLDGRLP